MHDTLLHRCEGPDRGDRIGEAFESVAADDADIGDTTVAQLREHVHPLLRALPAGRSHPQPENVTVTLQIDADSDVDRPVGDLPVADLDHERVDQHHRIDRIERTGLPFLHVAEHLVRHGRHQITRDVGSVEIGEVLGDIAGGHALRIQRDHRLVEPRDSALMLGHHHRRERARPVPRDLDREIADLGPHRLRRGSVPTVRRLLPDPIARVVAEVLGQLRFQRGLQDLPGQSRQQPVRASQFDPLTTSGGHELLRDRGDIRRRRKDLPGSQIDGLGLLSWCLQFSVHDVIHLPGRPKPNRSRRTPHTQTFRQTPTRTRHQPVDDKSGSVSDTLPHLFRLRSGVV